VAVLGPPLDVDGPSTNQKSRATAQLRLGQGKGDMASFGSFRDTLANVSRRPSRIGGGTRDPARSNPRPCPPYCFFVTKITSEYTSTTVLCSAKFTPALGQAFLLFANRAAPSRLAA